MLLAIETIRTRTTLGHELDTRLELGKLDFSLAYLASSRDFCVARQFPTILRPHSVPAVLEAQLIDDSYLCEYDMVRNIEIVAFMFFKVIRRGSCKA